MILYFIYYINSMQRLLNYYLVLFINVLLSDTSLSNNHKKWILK